MECRIELGSEFNLSLSQLNTVPNNLFSAMEAYNSFWLDSGRSAIRSLIIPMNKKILLPEYICESVIRCFCKEQLVFYHVDENFRIDLEDVLKKINDSIGLVFICHYFGYTQEIETLKAIKKATDFFGIEMVEDTTQSLFSFSQIIGDCAVASVRKWLPIPNGGVLFYPIGRNIEHCVPKGKCTDNERVAGMVLKELFLQGKYDTNSMYRELFAECEKRINESAEICLMSDFSKFIIQCIDVEKMIEIRKKNTLKLVSWLKKQNVAVREFSERECPLAVPIRIKNRDSFRNFLMENRIYCAVHWPFDGINTEQRKQAGDNARELISLPIDQRYSDIEMDYLINVISRYKGELSF